MMDTGQAKDSTTLSLDASDDDGEQNGFSSSAQDSYRSEIEDIVKGFILEKDLMSHGHQEEMLRMRQSFDREKAELLRHLGEERENMRQNSRMTSITSNETGYISGSHDSEALHLNLYGGELSGMKKEANSFAQYDVDNSLVKDIAEVYLRLNNGMMTSRIRPDLDIEDKFEREREIFERKFISEKRDLKRKLEEEYSYKLEQEKNRYENQIQEMKSTITDLQWQKRELESKIRNEKEKYEINFERERNEIEKKHLHMVHEMKRKIEEQHSKDIVHQKDKYEENISELQSDIGKLTTQLRELNENLRQEKEIIMNKFEKEIKEMEQTFSEQRSSIKLSLEADFALKLENEISVFKTINKKLQEDIETLEKDKKEYERKQKEERRKLEDRYEDEITDMDKKHTDEKRNIKLKLDERYQQIISHEKNSLEVTVNQLREEIVLLRQENAQIEAAFDNRQADLRRQLEVERDECRKKLVNAENEIRMRLESEFSQKVANESSGHLELVQQLDRDLGMMKARYSEVEGVTISLQQERDILVRERDEMERKLKNIEFEVDRRKTTPRDFTKDAEIDKFKEIIRSKEQEISNVKLQKEQIEIGMSGVRREKMDLEDEVTKLKRAIATSALLDEKSQRPSVENNKDEVISLRENVRRKEEEMQGLKKQNFELESRVSFLQRKNEELEDELSALRRKKLEVEDEISSVKRDKADSENQISVLRKEKMDLDEIIIAIKRKQSDLEDKIAAHQRDEMNKDYEASLMKRTIQTLENEIVTLQKNLSEKDNDLTKLKQEQPLLRASADTARSSRQRQVITEETVEKAYGQRQSDYDDLNQSLLSIEEDVDELVRQKKDLEYSVQHLKDSKEQLERNISKLQNQKKQASIESGSSEDSKLKIGELERRHKDLQIAVDGLEKRKRVLERDIETLESQLSKNINNNSKYHNDFSSDEKESFYKINTASLNEMKLIENDIGKLEAKRSDLENIVSRLEKDKNNIEREIASLKYQLQDEIAANRSNLDDTLASLKDKCNELQNQVSRLGREESSLEGRVKDLKTQDHELSKRVRDIEIDRQRIQKDIQLLKDEKDRFDNEKQQRSIDDSTRGSATRFTGVSQVSIERVRKHDHKDHELAELRKERDSLIRELTILKKNMDGKNSRDLMKQRNVQNKNDTNKTTFTNDLMQMEHTEVVALKKERLDIEQSVAALLRQKTEMNTEIGVIGEEKKREEEELSSLRRERIELQTSVTTLQSKKTRLEAELSVIMEELKREDNEVTLLRRQKNNIENEFYELQRKKATMQSEISIMESDLISNEKRSAEFYTDTKDIEHDLRKLRSERTDIESDIKRLQSVRNREEHELNTLRKQLKDLQVQISDLKNAETITRSIDLKTSQNKWDVKEPYDRGSSPQSPLSPGQRVRTSIEIPYVIVPGSDGQMRRSFDPTESESVMIPDSDSYFAQTISAPQQDTWLTQRKNDERISNYSSSQILNSSYSFQTISRDDDRGKSSYPACGTNNKAQPIEKYSETNTTDRQTKLHDPLKEDNDVTYLRREKQEIQSQITELRIILTKLQTEINDLENYKMVSETLNGRHNNLVYQQKEEDIHRELKTEMTHIQLEEKNDKLISEYEEKIRELKEQNSVLKQKVGLLEWQVENTKQKMDIQEMSFRRELSALKEQHGISEGAAVNINMDCQSTKLKEFYHYLNNLVVKDISSEEIVKEICKAIKELEQSKDVNFTTKNSSSVNSLAQYHNIGISSSNKNSLDNDKAMADKEYIRQLKVQLNIADKQLKTCEKIIHRLYAENSDLNKMVHKLESKLKTTTRTQEKLNRKRALLQKLVEKLSGQVGKDQLRQSYLVLELDKDVAI